jgi:hypothetical protein
MADQRTGQHDLEQQAQMATAAFRETAAGLLQADQARPEAVILGVAQVTGELGSAMALTSGESLEALLDALGMVVRQAGREHRRALQMAMLPAAGSA